MITPNTTLVLHPSSKTGPPPPGHRAARAPCQPPIAHRTSAHRSTCCCITYP